MEEADNHAGIVNVTDTSLNLEEIPRVQTPDNAKKICAGSEPSSCVPSTSQENNSSVQTNNLCTGILPFDVPSPFKGALLWPVQTPAAKRKRFKEKIPTVVTSAAWQEYHRKKEHEKLKKTKEKEERIALREQRKLKELMEKKNIFDDKIPITQTKKRKEKTSKQMNCDISNSESEEEWIPSESEDEWVPNSSSDDNFDNNVGNKKVTNEIENKSIDSISNNKAIECQTRKELQVQLEQGISIKQGDYVLVAFPGKTDLKNYVCVVQELLSNSEVEVVGMICCNKEKTTFKLNHNDVSTINISQVVNKLAFPNLITTGRRHKYVY